MLDEHPDEPLDGTHESPMDHHRPGPVVGAVGVGEIEVLRLGEVDLKGGELPAAPDGVPNVDVDLWAVEGTLASAIS